MIELVLKNWNLF